MSSIPSSAMPHVTSLPSPAVVSPAVVSEDRFDGRSGTLLSRAKSVPTSAWAAGAAAIGLAAAAVVGTLYRDRLVPAPRRRRAPRKSQATGGGRKRA